MDVLEAAVAGAVAGDVGRLRASDRLRRRAPELAGVVVADVDRLARRVADRVVGPRRELVLAAVARPRCSRTRTRRPGTRTTELAITFSHGAGVDWPGPEDDDVLAPAVGEAAESVEELELGAAAVTLVVAGWCCGRSGAGGARRGRVARPLEADDLIGQACRDGSAAPPAPRSGAASGPRRSAARRAGRRRRRGSDGPGGRASTGSSAPALSSESCRSSA